MRVRGRARDVGDAEPHDGGAEARAQAAQPVPAAAAAVDRQTPPLPGVLDGGRRFRCCCCGRSTVVPLSFDVSSLFVFSLYLHLSNLLGSEMYSHSSSCIDPPTECRCYWGM
jgi:hypothetical protein